MRTAEQVLGVIHERGKRGLPLEDVYRQLYNPALYQAAYGKIYRNDGAMTPGTTAETVDGMSEEKIRGIIALLREEKYHWSPVRRVNIPKASDPTKTRPLGLPTWSDKLLQEVIRSILEAYYEPQFDPHSHGFRPNRGCGTAIAEVYYAWRGTVWFIEGDIKGCFDNIDQSVLLATIAEKIHDNRFLRLLDGLLKAGYLEDWRYNKTLSGTPQGGIVSPILANIYLDRLDRHVAGTLIPRHTRGDRREHNPAYNRTMEQARQLRIRGQRKEAEALYKEAKAQPSVDTNDPNYRRLRYIRYADDFLLGFVGTREEAEAIKTDLTKFMADTLKLALSVEKTRITHARTEAARFLGYELSTTANDTHRTEGRRTLNGLISLRIPEDVIQQKCARYKKGDTPIHRKELTNNTPYTIVAQYQAEYRGLANYYRMAHNLARLRILKWTMEQSLTKTLAAKLKIHVSAVYRRYHARIPHENGQTYKGLQVTVEREGKKPLVATWGGVNLARKMVRHLDDNPYRVWFHRTELVQRLLAEECELCGSTERINVHHIRKLSDLQKHGRTPPRWVKTMAARRRKTLVLCHTCHVAIHAGKPTRNERESPGEPDDAKVSRPVRRGADGKVPA